MLVDPVEPDPALVRRAAGGPGVAGPAGRSARGRAGRPATAELAPDGPRGRRRPGALRLPRGRRRAARHRPQRRARHPAGAGRPVGRGQVHARPAARRASTRRGPARSRWAAPSWPGCPPSGSARTSPWSTRSTTSSSGIAARQPAARQGGRRRRRAVGGAARGRRRRRGRGRCPTGWTPRSAPGGVVLTPAQAQQLALARLVLADPHTLVLDEATSLLDPRAARHLERSLSAGAGRPHGRRHRAPAAHRARRRPSSRWSRTAGSASWAATTQLVAADGAYAALWRSWHG